MRSPAKRNLRPEHPFDDALIVLGWLLILWGACVVIGWLCYRLFQCVPLIVLPPTAGGS